LGVVALLNFTGFVSSSGYAAIFILAVLQSCCIPTSSELTMGFAGVLAAEGKLDLPAVIAVGAAGEVVGAYIAWMIGRFGGRPFVDRYGKYILLSHRDLDRAEEWYDRHGRWGVFGSRLLPLIRNFVALPAGIAEVPLVRFGVLTALGSLIWDGAMAGIGYAVGGRWQSIMHGFSDAGYVLGVLVVLALAFVVYHRYRSYKAATSGTAGAFDGLATRTARNRGAHVRQSTPPPSTLGQVDPESRTVRMLPPESEFD
jgi:membrane protein DedA with SNARE-associated domain